MESVGKIAKFSSAKPKKDAHLHSPAHLLADELSQKFNDKKHFGFYLKMATLYDHQWLRKLCGEVLESKAVKTPGKLFAYLIKKRNEELKAKYDAKKHAKWSPFHHEFKPFAPSHTGDVDIKALFEVKQPEQVELAKVTL